MQNILMRFPRLWLVLALGLLLLLIGSAVTADVGAQPSQDEAAIRQVCHDAVNALQTLPTPPTSYNGGVMPASMVQEMVDTVPSVLKNYYIGTLLTTLTKSLQAAIRSEKSGQQRYRGGGIDSFTFSKITIQNTSASAITQVATWQEVSQVENNGNQQVSTAHNHADITFTLVRVNGQWLISGQSNPVPSILP